MIPKIVLNGVILSLLIALLIVILIAILIITTQPKRIDSFQNESLQNESFQNFDFNFNTYDPRTLMNWYQSNKHHSLIVEIKNNQYEIFGTEFLREKGLRDSAECLKIMMERLKMFHPVIPDCMFIHFLGDRDITHDLPVFHNSTLTYVKGLLSPLWYYTIKSKLDTILALNQKKWEEKVPKAIWRGSTTGDSTNNFRVGFRTSRRYVVDTSLQFPDLIDAKFTNFTDEFTVKKYRKYPAMDPSEQCNYKYIVSMDGNGGTYGLYWTLSSGSCCLNNFKYRQWFSPFFEENTHYISFDDSADNSNLNFVIESLKLNDSSAKQIAAQSKARAAKIFRESHVIDYLFRELSKYSAIQRPFLV